MDNEGEYTIELLKLRKFVGELQELLDGIKRQGYVAVDGEATLMRIMHVSFNFKVRLPQTND